MNVRLKLDPATIDSPIKLGALGFVLLVVLAVVFSAIDERVGFAFGGMAAMLIVGLLWVVYTKGRDKREANSELSNFDESFRNAAKGTGGTNPAVAKRPSELLLPQGYDFDAVKDHVLRKYGAGTGVLVVQYGSTMTDHATSQSDTDFIVLCHGNLYDKKPNRVTSGFLGSVSFDIHEQLLDSFLFACMMGKPYEVSVALDGIPIDSYQIDEVYFEWMAAMVKNLSYGSSYIAKELKFELGNHRLALEKARRDSETFETVVSMYWILTTLIQIGLLQKMSRRITYKDVYPLSKCGHLEDELTNSSVMAAFGVVCRAFKNANDGTVDMSQVDLCFAKAQTGILQQFGPALLTGTLRGEADA